MVARTLTAFVGSYAAAAGIAALSARLMPIARSEATVWAMILSFLVYAAFILWAFREPRLIRVATIIWGVAIVTGGVAWLLGPAA